jgi:hypothetical protein
VLEDILKREDVILFIDDLRSNERYFKKNDYNFSSNGFYHSNELALYIFYDALVKYYIILDDIFLFDEYLENLERLFRKIDNFEGISLGVNKLICKMVAIHLNLKDWKSDNAKKEIINYIYDQYIINGYLIHGLSVSYKKDIEEQGFIPEVYKNLYQRYIDMINIFDKYDVCHIINKDFKDNKVYFTDDIVMACYYSNYAPMFFYKFLTNEELFGKRAKNDAFLTNNFDMAIAPLKKFMNNASFSDKDKKFVVDLVQDQWNLLHEHGNKICLMLVKRKRIYNDEKINSDEFINDNGDIFDIIDRLLSSKRNNVYFNEPINNDEIEFVTFDSYYLEKKKHIFDEEAELEKYRKNESNNEFLDKYGFASVFMLLGSILICLGVIITVLMCLWGMD